MNFKSKWITTEDFANLPIRNVLCKESAKQDLSPSAITNYHTHFRKKFFLDDTKNVSICISADDYYKLYINGEFVCQGPGSAYPSNYKYNHADISPYLRPGENIIAVHVYYQGLINRVWVSGDNRMGLIADVYRGEEYLFGTDETFKYSVAKEYGGDTIGYETSFLESIDFNLAEKGWRELSFDDGGYLSAVCKDDTDYTFSDEPIPTVDVYPVKPEEIKKLAPGRYFIDFGGEIVGTFSMCVKGEKGQKVNILCGEELLDEDALLVRHDMRCNCNYNEVCTLSGDTDKFEFFDYKAFRYVNVFTDIDNLNPETFAATVSHHSFRQIRFLRTELPHLEDIWNMCARTLRFSAQENFYDCPTREKGSYLGDSLVIAHSHYLLTGDLQIYKKTMLDFAETSAICKGLMCISTCSLMQELADYSLLFPYQLLTYYRLTEDIETTKKLYPTVLGVLEYFKSFERADGLLENVFEKWNMVDWPENLNDNYDAFIPRDTYGIDCHNVLNAYYIGALKAASELGALLSSGDSFDYRTKEEAFNKAFFDKELGLYCDTEKKTHAALHSNVLPVFFDIAESDALPHIGKFIVKKGFSCGVWFSYFVMKALIKLGDYEEVVKLLTSESERSFANMLSEGATTCFEAWGKDQKWNTSLCHPWATSPIIIITEDLDGKFGIAVEKI